MCHWLELRIYFIINLSNSDSVHARETQLDISVLSNVLIALGDHSQPNMTDSGEKIDTISLDNAFGYVFIACFLCLWLIIDQSAGPLTIRASIQLINLIIQLYAVEIWAKYHV